MQDSCYALIFNGQEIPLYNNFRRCTVLISQKIYPESVIRLNPYFVLLSARLYSAFIGNIAGCTGKKLEARLRQQCGIVVILNTPTYVGNLRK